MNKRAFITPQGLRLIIKNRRSAVILEITEGQGDTFTFQFSEEEFAELFNYFVTVANKSWVNLTPKEASSHGADYYEYYDRELDNNGYLSIRENMLSVGRPTTDSTKLYQFNKRKMESFLYDFEKLIKRGVEST